MLNLYIEAPKFAEFLLSIYNVIHRTVEKHGLTCVSQACGMILVLSPHNKYNIYTKRMNKENMYLTDVLTFIHSLQQNLYNFMQYNKCSIIWSIGLDHGSVIVGFNGHNHVQYDALGSTRDYAVALSQIKSNGAIYVSRAFDLAAKANNSSLPDQALFENMTVKSICYIAGKEVSFQDTF